MRRDALSEIEINARISQLNGWAYDNGCLLKTLKFDDFKTAWAFMNDVAKVAESLDHHPDWRNVYNQVEIRLSTHSSNGISLLDFELATSIDALI
jgi:4a-hydroxytetrahydrobiopterin dehydratase